MSRQLIARSPDLKRLQDEGYHLEVRSGYLLLHDVPYVTASREVRRGTLASTLALAGDLTARPDTHVAFFSGDYPCRADGTEISQIRHSSGARTLADGVAVQHSFSAKPTPAGSYPDYYSKMTTYASLLAGPAQAIDPSARPQTFPVIQPEATAPSTPFAYIDTASSRAEIDVVTARLARLNRVAIVGLGGTGSYVLDLVAKTPVREIHLYDGDFFLQHNAFRSPGAPSVDELRRQRPKVVWFQELYGKMHTGIVAHPFYLDRENVRDLAGSDVVFLCIDSSVAKAPIVHYLETLDVPFIDVGMGVHVADGALGGIVRVTASTPRRRDHFRSRVSLGAASVGQAYDRNIQIADLNALNAAIAVIKWKKLVGFYRDLKEEHHSQFTIDGNLLVNDDRPL